MKSCTSKKTDGPVNAGCASGMRDYAFWKKHGGGLVWSNPDASDSIMMAYALLSPNFHRLLEIAVRFGLDRLAAEWRSLEEECTANGFPEELKRLDRARPTVERCLRHMRKGIAEGRKGPNR